MIIYNYNGLKKHSIKRMKYSLKDHRTKQNTKVKRPVQIKKRNLKFLRSLGFKVRNKL